MKNNFFALFFLIFSTASIAADCSHLIGQCEYYLCREKLHTCGDNGYYLKFAYKYCKKSEDKLALKMSEQGKKWIKGVASCLQESVDRVSEDEACPVVKRLATIDHSECYVQEGFCSLRPKDQFHILYMLKKELYHRKFFAEGLEVLKQCAFN